MAITLTLGVSLAIDISISVTCCLGVGCRQARRGKTRGWRCSRYWRWHETALGEGSGDVPRSGLVVMVTVMVKVMVKVKKVKVIMEVTTVCKDLRLAARRRWSDG